MEPVGGINKDMCGAKLLQTTVSAYAVNCICFFHLLKTQHCSLCPCGMYNLPLAAHPPPPPTTHPLIHIIRDIKVAVKYHITRIFGGHFNLVVWQILFASPN